MPASCCPMCGLRPFFGMPDFLMHGRVCVLSKCDCPKAFNDGRPITVLSAIYRLWSSVLSLQLLRLWQHKLPSSIYGGVPGRSARDITFALQHRIEAALLNKEELSGFVLDLTKCFNLLPRPPLGQLLPAFGLPSPAGRLLDHIAHAHQTHSLLSRKHARGHHIYHWSS